MYSPPLLPDQQTYHTVSQCPPAVSLSPPVLAAFSAFLENSSFLRDPHDPLLPYPSSAELSGTDWAGLLKKVREVKAQTDRAGPQKWTSTYEGHHLFLPSECSTPVGGGPQTLVMCWSVGLCSVNLQTSPWHWSCSPAWSGWWDTASYSAPPVSDSTFRGKMTTRLFIYGTAPAASITHRPSVAVCRVQVINQDSISEEVFKHCKGSTRQEILRNVVTNQNIHNFFTS